MHYLRPYFTDPVGDVGDAPVWVDIERVTGSVSIFLAGPKVSVPEPTIAWIAYGVVLDMDGDGVGDRRLGMDNALGPIQAGDGGGHREWIADLTTGEITAFSAPYGHDAFGVGIDSYYIGETYEGRDGPEVRSDALWLRIQTGDYSYYAWASLIRDGELVATDFAPDEGWIRPYD
jgi:hypothetical protein